MFVLTSLQVSVSLQISSVLIEKFIQLPMRQLLGGKCFFGFLKHSSTNSFMILGRT